MEHESELKPNHRQNSGDGNWGGKSLCSDQKINRQRITERERANAETSGAVHRSVGGGVHSTVRCRRTKPRGRGASAERLLGSWESARLLLVRSHRADHGQREEPREGLHSREKIEPWQEKTNGGLEIEERARTGHCCSKNRSLEFTEEQQLVLTNWLSLHWS
jgi:hypothetical protein